MASRMSLRSARWAIRSEGSRSKTGMTRSLQIMVDSAMVATMTMPVAADMPPMKTSSARLSL